MAVVENGLRRRVEKNGLGFEISPMKTKKAVAKAKEGPKNPALFPVVIVLLYAGMALREYHALLKLVMQIWIAFPFVKRCSIMESVIKW